MDAARFDALSRYLGQSRSRRTLLGGLAALLGALPTLGLAGERRTKRRFGADGPCGNGGPRANRCRRHRDCCTRLCDRRAGRRHGRCRCRQQGERCRQDRNCCRGGGQDLGCFGRRCRGRGRCGTGGPCQVFVSSREDIQGNMDGIGGLTGADRICQDLADAANLPGTYKAWLSDATTSPASRFVHNPGPYVLVDGTKIAADWADLTDGSLAAPIDVTEQGAVVPPFTTPWTNTQSDGSAGGAFPDAHCLNWTSASPNEMGNSGRATIVQLWTSSNGAEGCGNTFGWLYCFQQG